MLRTTQTMDLVAISEERLQIIASWFYVSAEGANGT